MRCLHCEPIIPFKRRAPLLIFVLLALVLSGCSLFYSYRNIDRYIRWSLDDYIDWSGAQDQQLRERLQVQMQWNRTTQLPRYRAWLLARMVEAEGDVEAAQWRSAADQLQDFWQDAMAHAADDICAQLATLSDRQVRDLIATMREKQSDLAAEFADETVDEAVKRRSRTMEKAVKYWLGPLDDKQREAIANWSRALPDMRQRWLDSRARWTDAFEHALAQRHEAEIFSAQIQQLFVTPQENWDAEYRDISQHRLDVDVQLFAALHNASSAHQRQAERERIAQWLRILDDLAAN